MSPKLRLPVVDVEVLVEPGGWGRASINFSADLPSEFIVEERPLAPSRGGMSVTGGVD